MKLIRGNLSFILYGASLALLLLLLKFIEFRLLIVNYSFEIYIGTIALVFTTLGIWLAHKLLTPKVAIKIVEKEIVIEKKIYVNPGEVFTVNEEEIARIGLSGRELEVLRLMAEGMSNQEIAERLYVSLNTIKTHSSKIFEKMETKRRMQAVEKAKKLGIIS